MRAEWSAAPDGAFDREPSASGAPQFVLAIDGTQPEGHNSAFEMEVAMRKSLRCGVLIGCLSFQIGCSLFVWSRQSITITPTDQNAEITVDGKKNGVR
jgi:hypothetical protein